jgi:KAP family P-loop domain
MNRFASWWHVSARDSLALQWRRLLLGCVTGSLIAIAIHLLLRDSAFLPVVQVKLAPRHKFFDGFSAYKAEAMLLLFALIVLLSARVGIAVWRYLCAWWSGIVSLTVEITAIVATVLLQPVARTRYETVELASLVIGVIVVEMWRAVEANSRTNKPRQLPRLAIPERASGRDRESGWLPSNTDDPIVEWNEDMIGRDSVVELLAEHVFIHRTPILALHAGLGDGKTSVLRLLSRSIGKHAITVSFSTWLPNSDETLALDLFRDIASQCKRQFHIPQLKRRAIAYARTISGSVSYLAGLREILRMPSQQEEIEELRETLARVPVPIVALLDEIDRMQREEILVLLKILRGASSFPNVTFICAFSEKEVTKQLSTETFMSNGYLEKFFPVSVNLTPPSSDMLGRLVQSYIRKASRDGSWFIGTDEKAFGDLLDGIWNGALAQLCTNFRKASLLLNDVRTSANIIGGEVNTIDLIGIEAIRRFEPRIYEVVRRNPVLLTYGAESWLKGQYVSDKEKKEDTKKLLQLLDSEIDKSVEPDALRYILSLLFPACTTNEAHQPTFSITRPTNADIADEQKRICDADYFTIYFRAAIPENMFSEAELSITISLLNSARTESACNEIFGEVLNGIPRQQTKRADFLWKLGLSVRSRLNDTAAENIAYTAATRANDYTYDVINSGESARALNIVFESAQRFSSSAKVQQILTGAMERATDDTFALRLLEYTENRDRNKILTHYKFIDTANLGAAFIERMRKLYGRKVDANLVDISTGDTHAFLRWINNSDEDRGIEIEFWGRYIGNNRKRLAKAINFIYPGGYTWSEDPRNWVDKFMPIDNLKALLETADGAETLDAIDLDGIDRFKQLLKGRWFDITRRILSEDIRDTEAEPVEPDAATAV